MDDDVEKAPPPPSPVWLGAFSTAFLGAAVVWILLYTLLDLPWVEPLGAWNYLVALLLSTVALQALQFWHGDPTRASD